jgi:hypothetical protein
MVSGISYQVGAENSQAFGAAERLRCAITSRSTRRLDSMAFMVHPDIASCRWRSARVISGVRPMYANVSNIMAITDKTRKLLWGRSGNRCALCKRPLVSVVTDESVESVLGEECHIIARSVDGPSGQTDEPTDRDSYNNLILLCREDHKRIDDNPNYFSKNKLLEIKRAHEIWVHQCLEGSLLHEIKVYRARNERETILQLMLSGRQLLNVCLGCCMAEYVNPNLQSEDEVDLVGRFFQDIQDWSDVYYQIGPHEQIRAEYKLGEFLKEIIEDGFAVYAAKLNRTIEINGRREPWPTALIQVNRIEEVESKSESQMAMGASA